MVAAQLAALVERAEQFDCLDAAFKQSLANTAQLAAGFEPYMESCTTAQSPELAELVVDTHEMDWQARKVSGETCLALEQEMLSGHVEGQFLKMLVRAMGARRVLEIGLFTGYSALAMAEALPHGGELVACELDPFAASVAQRAMSRSPHYSKIRVEVGDAAVSMQRLLDEGESFDLIFIDADKSGYAAYFQLALSGCLLSPNGLICVDNTLMQGIPYGVGQPTANGQAIADFNRLVAQDARVEQVLLPLRDGLTLIRRC
jgi:caffeoyl-CoA O-methyltransferase